MNLIINYKKSYMECLLSLMFGIFGVLAFSPYDFWPASIFSLTGLLILILNSTTYSRAAGNALFWGIGFFSVGLYWIYIGINRFIKINSYISILAMILLIVYLSCFPVLFSTLFIIFRSRTNQWQLISIAPILWSITERLRGNEFIGFPWLQFGYSQINGPIKGIAPILGVEGITFFLVLISGLLALSIKKNNCYQH